MNEILQEKYFGTMLYNLKDKNENKVPTFRNFQE
jgi:hypothetical protein